MNIVQIVFSPTGGTQKAADMITSAWDTPVRKVDLPDPETDFSAVSLEKDDVAVIAVPSFGGRVPAPAIQRLEKINGNQAMGILVCVYGNRAYERIQSHSRYCRHCGAFHRTPVCNRKT